MADKMAASMNQCLGKHMKPVAILQHEQHMGPGSLHECLQQLAVPLQLIRTDKGQAVPKDAQAFSGIVLLDSERSALDRLNWIRAELSLCKESLAQGVPVLGLGYGAQLLAVAAGGSVAPSNSPSYGWTPSWLTPQAGAWFDVPTRLEIFNAHDHTLELPPEAECFLLDRHCHNKGFTLGQNMGLLCPLGLTPVDLVAWCARKGTKLAQAKGPDVQNRISMQRALPERMGKLNTLAHRIFTRWAQQLPGAPRPVDFVRLAA
ncbi:gamma-glutamyl-gamma-aminobutyrate hydrolase family protein [Variovorax sp. ZS18.2.2]|uniref:type 1 glutamine amidotransferase n=1 Tax=Variovorax sp. ZS18.2.2 TaxID=2971255 RepID=UPI002150EAD9|nr:gamma-glutamyl-gamma-aminobutyrate hydrolase family protein [Variovorax sp. ZS18.2.2]MCR6478176.1 gamma-glutamyl-gamma-aminobutyrate hydrolase family protein [Variovorax sp. ZS18.2.2]